VDRGPGRRHARSHGGSPLRFHRRASGNVRDRVRASARTSCSRRCRRFSRAPRSSRSRVRRRRRRARRSRGGRGALPVARAGRRRAARSRGELLAGLPPQEGSVRQHGLRGRRLSGALRSSAYHSIAVVEDERDRRLRFDSSFQARWPSTTRS
jgi:hypothetical protein